MQLGSINKTQIVILALILEIAAGVLFYFYFYVPKNNELKELLTVIEKKQRDKREIELTKRSLADTKREIEFLKAQIQRLEKFLPEEVHVPRVLVLIESLASATHLNINTIKPSASSAVAAPGAVPGARPPTSLGGPTAAAKPGAPAQAAGKLTFNSTAEYRTSVIEFNVSGSFRSMYNFLRELSSFPKLVVVDNITASTRGQQTTGTKTQGASEKPKENSLDINMPLTFYIQQKAPQLRF